MSKVLIPEDNAKDLADIPENVKSALEIVPVAHLDQVLEHALVEEPKPIVWTEADEAIAANLRVGKGSDGSNLAH